MPIGTPSNWIAYEAVVRCDDGSIRAKHTFWYDKNATGAQLIDRVWEIWSLARVGPNGEWVDPTLTVKPVVDDEATVIAEYRDYADRLRREAATIRRTQGMYVHNPAMHDKRRRDISKLEDMAMACEMAVKGCQTAASKIAAFRFEGGF